MNTADMLSDVRRRLPAARNAILCAVGDMPSRGGSEGVSGGGTGEWGPTVTIAMNCHRDQAYKDLGRLTELEWANRTQGGLTSHQLEQLFDLCNRWAPDGKRRQVLEDGLRAAANDELNYRGDTNNCRSCARVPGQWGDPHRQGLCKRCDHTLARITEMYEHDYDMPPRELLERTCGRKITNGDITNAMHGHRRTT